MHTRNLQRTGCRRAWATGVHSAWLHAWSAWCPAPAAQRVACRLRLQPPAKQDVIIVIYCRYWKSSCKLSYKTCTCIMNGNVKLRVYITQINVIIYGLLSNAWQCIEGINNFQMHHVFWKSFIHNIVCSLSFEAGQFDAYLSKNLIKRL